MYQGKLGVSQLMAYQKPLRHIEVNLRAQARWPLYMWFRYQVLSRSTLANANATRPWQNYADSARHFIGMPRRLYASALFTLDLDATVYALNDTTISLRRCAG